MLHQAKHYSKDKAQSDEAYQDDLPKLKVFPTLLQVKVVNHYALHNNEY